MGSHYRLFGQNSLFSCDFFGNLSFDGRVLSRGRSATDATHPCPPLSHRRNAQFLPLPSFAGQILRDLSLGHERQRLYARQLLLRLYQALSWIYPLRVCLFLYGGRVRMGVPVDSALRRGRQGDGGRLQSLEVRKKGDGQGRRRLSSVHPGLSVASSLRCRDRTSRPGICPSAATRGLRWKTARRKK